MKPFDFQAEADVVIEALQLQLGCKATITAALFDAHEAGRLSVTTDTPNRLSDEEVALLACADSALSVLPAMLCDVRSVIAMAKEIAAYRARVIPTAPPEPIDWAFV